VTDIPKYIVCSMPDPKGDVKTYVGKLAHQPLQGMPPAYNLIAHSDQNAFDIACALNETERQ